jgi:hypothetical protein
MKDLRKKDKIWICEECGSPHEKLNGLLGHIALSHNSQKYFDKWIKEEGDDRCKVCGGKTEFVSIFKGYKNGCCRDHISQYVYSTSQKAILKKYGVLNPYQSEEIKEKIKKTNIEKFGVENPSQSEEIKIKKEATCLKNYGYKSGLCNIEKRRQTCLKKYGVEFNTQNKEILEKGQKTAKTLKRFKDTSIWYQGSYELDFLEKYYSRFPDMERGPSIKYFREGKRRIYFPDFYIPSLNLIIEIKSSWIKNIDAELKEKKNETIRQGYNYIMILNKNYNKFKEYEK